MISTRKLCTANKKRGLCKLFSKQTLEPGRAGKEMEPLLEKDFGWTSAGNEIRVVSPSRQPWPFSFYPVLPAPAGSSTSRRRRRRFRFSSGSTRGTEVVQTHTWCRRWWNTGGFSDSPPPLGWLPTSGAPDAPRGLCLCPGARLGAEGERLFCYCSEIRTNKQTEITKD